MGGSRRRFSHLVGGAGELRPEAGDDGGVVARERLGGVGSPLEVVACFLSHLT